MFDVAVRRVKSMLREKDDRQWLLEMMPPNSVCAEIGVYQGRFTECILPIVRPKMLHLIDPWKYQPGPEFRGAMYGSKVPGGQQRMDRMYSYISKAFRCDNVQIHRGTSAELSTQFPDNYFDWIYVDGDHHYGAVKQDLELYLPKVKPGGLVALDDYNREKIDWGVTLAADEIVAKGLYELVLKRDYQCLLRRPG